MERGLCVERTRSTFLLDKTKYEEIFLSFRNIFDFDEEKKRKKGTEGGKEGKKKRTK